MTEMNEVSRVSDNDMTVTISGGEENYFTRTVYSTGTFGNLNFWSGIHSERVVFDPLCEVNALKRDHAQFVPVTITSGNLPATGNTAQNGMQEFISLPAIMMEYLNRIGWAFYMIAGLLWFMAGIVTSSSGPIPEVIGWTLFELIFGGVLGTIGSVRLINGSRAVLNAKPVIAHTTKPKLGEFPVVGSKFHVLSERTAAVTQEVLETSNNALMNTLVERKLEIERNHEDFTTWINSVWKIVDNDPNFPVDGIPLVTDQTVRIADELAAQVKMERDHEKRNNEREMLAVFTEERIVDAQGVEILKGFARDDSVRAAEIAQNYMAERKWSLYGTCR